MFFSSSAVAAAAADGDTVRLSNQYLSDFTGGTSASVGYKLLSTGQAQKATGGAGYVNIPGEYLSAPDTGKGADYQFKLDVDSGDAPSGSAIGTWLDNNVALTWGLSVTNPDVKAGNYTLTCRRKATGTVVASCSITMQVEAT